MAGTEGVNGFPFWSNDSRYIGFFAGGKLKKVAVGGGPPQTLCDASGVGGTWSQDVILFESQNALHRVPAPVAYNPGRRISAMDRITMSRRGDC